MEKLTIENFRNIKGKLTIDLAKINILTGPNNSGKSSILKALILFSDYLLSRDHTILSFNGYNSDKHKIDCYQNAINWTNWKNDKSLRITYERNKYQLFFEFMPLLSKIEGKKSESIQMGKLSRFEFISKKNQSRLCISLNNENEYILHADQLIIRDLWIKRFDEAIEEETMTRMEENEKSFLRRLEKTFIRVKNLDTSDSDFLKEMYNIGRFTRNLQDTRIKLKELRSGKNKKLGKDQIKIPFNTKEDSGLMLLTIPSIVSSVFKEYFKKYLVEKDSENQTININEELRNITRQLKKFVDISVIHLNPDRSNQARIHLNTESITEIGRIIWSFKVHPFAKDEPADKFLIKWMKYFKIGNNYRFRNMEGIATVIEIKDKYGWHNLVDKGFGAGQIFSVLFRIAESVEKNRKKDDWMYEKGVTPWVIFPVIIAIEEPEANLHPKFQSMLADIFMDAIENSNVQFIIETHSEYLIRRFQYLVADRKNNLKNTDLSILFFQDADLVKKDTEQVYNLEIRPDGMLKKDFGSGFFDEATNQTIELLKKQNLN